MFGSSVAGATPPLRAGAGARAAPARRRRPAPPAARKAAAANQSSSCTLFPAEERRERSQPVAAGRERYVAHAGSRQGGDDRTALGGRGRGEALAQAAVAGVDAKLPARLRIDKPELADVGELLLARIAHLDREHRVPPREPEQRCPPVAWT